MWKTNKNQFFLVNLPLCSIESIRKCILFMISLFFYKTFINLVKRFSTMILLRFSKIPFLFRNAEICADFSFLNTVLLLYVSSLVWEVTVVSKSCCRFSNREMRFLSLLRVFWRLYNSCLFFPLLSSKLDQLECWRHFGVLLTSSLSQPSSLVCLNRLHYDNQRDGYTITALNHKVLWCKTNTIPILMHQMRISTT
jgi:hypothetical protein